MKIRLSFMIVLLSLLVPCIDSAYADDNKVRLAGMMSAANVATKMIDGKACIAKMQAAGSTLSAYSFQFEMLAKRGKKSEWEKGIFNFKKPHFLRVEEVGDYKKGSVAIVGADGKVRGHMGGLLKAVVLTLSPDSSLLVAANGYPLVKSDFASLADAVAGFVASGMTSKVSEEPQTISGYDVPVYILEVYAKDGTIYKRAYLDAKTTLPVAWWDFDRGKVFAVSVWTHIQLNPTMNDSLFRM